MTEKSAFELHLEKLKNEYCKLLPNKIANIEGLWTQLQNQWQPDQLAILHREVHSMIGTSGTFGFMDVSKKARELEVVLKAATQTSTGEPLNTEFVQQIQLKIKQLKEELPQ